MYTLYFNKNRAEIVIKKGSGVMINSILPTDEVVQYNSNYYVCSNRKALKEKANLLKKQWVDEAETNMKRYQNIKI